MHDAIRAGLADTTAPDREERVKKFRRSMADSVRGEPRERRVPLTRLAVELMVARCSLTDAIAEVSVDEFWIVVRRGTAVLDPAMFRLSEHYTDHFGFLPALGGAQA
jgi:hypothetical protein